MLMESLRTRMARPAATSRAACVPRPGGTLNGRQGEIRGETPPVLELLPALRGSRYLLMAVKDRDGRYLEANEPYARALGLSVEAIRGRLDRDLLAPEVAGFMAQRERLALRGVILKPDLESFNQDDPAYLVERLPILDSAGQLRAVCVIAMEQPGVSPPEIARTEAADRAAPAAFAPAAAA